MTSWFHRCIAALVAVFPLFAIALQGVWQDSCPESPQARFTCLARQEVDFAGVLGYELALADAARLAGNPAYAAIVLERVVLRNPTQAGARLDLAIISLQIGDTLAAARHLNVLQSLPNPPPTVALLLQQLERRLNPSDQAFEGEAQFFGSLGFGYDTNPNLGVVADAIELVIDGQNQVLTPDSSMEPDPDLFFGLSGAMEYSYSPKGVVTGALMARQYDTLDDEDTLAASARLFHNLHGNSFLEATLADFRTADGLYLSRAGVGLRQRLGACRCTSVGVLADVLRGQENSSDATRGRVELASEGDLYGYKLLARTGLDVSRQPDADWEGTIGADVGVEVLARLGNASIGAELSAYKGWDEADYSPLFGDKRRDVLRGTLRAGISYPITKGLEAFVDWSYSQQESDVVLFEYRRHVSTLGVRLGF